MARQWIAAAFGMAMVLTTAATAQTLLAAGLAQPQPARPIPPRDRTQAEAPRGTAILRGSIVAADNGSPIRRAQVRVSA
jgi:hypothetical protein